MLLSVAQFNGQERAQTFVSCPPGVEWPKVVPRAHDAQPLPVDDNPSEVDWLAIEDELEQANRLAGKKPMVAPMKKRGQTSQGTSSDESLEGVIDLKEAEDPASKRRRLIADWPEEEDEEVKEVSSIIAHSRRERLARRQEPTPPVPTTEPTPQPPQPQVQASGIPKPTVAVRSDVAKPVPTTDLVVEKGAGPEKLKKSRFATLFCCTNL
jgi:hypothetical protein